MLLLVGGFCGSLADSGLAGGCIGHSVTSCSLGTSGCITGEYSSACSRSKSSAVRDVSKGVTMMRSVVGDI